MIEDEVYGFNGIIEDEYLRMKEVCFGIYIWLLMGRSRFNEFESVGLEMVFWYRKFLISFCIW